MRIILKRVTDWIRRYLHGLWIIAYMAFYLIGFFIVENAGHRHYHVIHTRIDDLIPFNEYFIIPYEMWFLFMAVGIGWFVFRCRNKTEYYKLVSVLSIGMTVFLIVSCVYPNCQDLRPTEFIRHNLFTDLVSALYRTDTPTNILPSIHVYNSLVLFFALNASPQLKERVLLRAFVGILAILIVISTMCLKQHSVVDVFLGTLMAVAVQMFCDRVFAEDAPAVREKA